MPSVSACSYRIHRDRVLIGASVQVAAPLPTSKSTKRAFYGTLVHSLSLTEIEYLEDALLGVDERGTIAFLEKSVQQDQVDARLQAHGWAAGEVQVIEMQRGEFLMPGYAVYHSDSTRIAAPDQTASTHAA